MSDEPLVPSFAGTMGGSSARRSASTGVLQRVRDWSGTGGTGNSSSSSSSNLHAAGSVSFSLSHAIYPDSSPSISPGGSSAADDDCGSSCDHSSTGSGSRGGTSRSSSGGSSSSGSPVYARTSSSVASLQNLSERGAASLCTSRSSASLVSMAILYGENGLLEDGTNDGGSLRRPLAGRAAAAAPAARKRAKPSRTFLYFRHRASASNVSVVLVGLLLCILAFHRILSLYMNHRRWLNAPITYMHRQCPAPAYELFGASLARLQPPPQSPATTAAADAGAATRTTTPAAPGAVRPSICLVTLTDSQSPSWVQRLVRWRNYAGILELTWPNKLAYARKHGYRLFDHSRYLDTSRPPAWSKIRAMQALLGEPVALTGAAAAAAAAASSAASSVEKPLPAGERCDWVVWTDADTVIMNSRVRIEDFLPALDSTYDLVVASDEGGGYNSGVLLLRNTDWSRRFLRTWWDMAAYVRPPGFSLSGDNAAMKALLADLPEFATKVAVPPRCTMNAFARFLTVRESRQVMDALEEQDWYMNERFYHKSDFIAHAPGYDNKAECIRLLLQEAE